jgi:Flp pilus assembly protein TadB
VDDMQEITELLREIRDLQKAHFERYKEFTQTILDREQASAVAGQQTRDEQHRFREEMRRTIEQNRQRARGLMVTRWVLLTIAATLAVVSAAWVMIVTFLGLNQWR